MNHENEIFFGAKSKTLFLDKSVKKAHEQITGADQATPKPAPDQATNGIALWGTDNLLPQKLIAEIERTGVLAAGVQAKIRIMAGKGPMPMRVVSVDRHGYEELEPVTDAEVLDYLDENDAFGFAFAAGMDLLQVGESGVQYVLSRDRKKIVQQARIDPCSYRVNEMQAGGASTKMFLSGDWNQFANPAAAGPHYATLDLLDSRQPFRDLAARTKGFLFAQRLQYPLFNRAYYALPPWYSALKWVRIAQGIPAMKEAMFNNQMNVKYVVSIHEDYWTRVHPKWLSGYTPEQRRAAREKFYDAMDSQLSGGDNSFKSVYIPRWKNAEGKDVDGLTITPIHDKIGDGKLLPDSAAANSEILFALMINPALLGVSMPGGSQVTAGSGSNIREAFLVQVMMQEIERRIISKSFDLVKRYNGWDPRIVIRYPSQILTTLNTGANTQSTA